MNKEMKVHKLKILPEYFEAVVKERKTFEIRKNDRLYEIGDMLRLQEYNQEEKKYTGKFIYVEVVYILDNPGFLIKGYVALGIRALGGSREN